MKRVGILIAVLSAIILVDVLVRSYGPDRDTSSLPSKDGDAVGEGVVGESPKTDLTSRLEKRRKDRAAFKKTLSVESDEKKVSPKLTMTRESCTRFVKAIVEKNGKALSKEDFASIYSEKTMVIRFSMIGMAEDYLSCKAVSETDYGLCLKSEEWFPISHTLINCATVFKLFIPLRAFYRLHLSREEFADHVADAPRAVREWMLLFFSVLEEKSPAACQKLADEPFVEGICRIAAQDINTAPVDSDLRKAFYAMLVLRTGDETYLSRMKEDSVVAAFIRTALGETGLCEKLFTDGIENICEHVDYSP